MQNRNDQGNREGRRQKGKDRKAGTESENKHLRSCEEVGEVRCFHPPLGAVALCSPGSTDQTVTKW